jgi:hypothetical protein
MAQRKIRNLLINKKFQLRITLKFLVCALLFSVLNGVAIFFILWSALSEGIPGFGEIELYFRMATIQILALNGLLIIALITGLGIVVTHRIAGPVYRIQRELERVLQGEKVESIRLRRGDELHKFAEVINQVLERYNQ